MEGVNEEIENGVLAGPAQTETGEGDADLRYRKQTARVGQQAEGGQGARMSVLRHLSQTGLPDGQERDFRAREKAVHSDQQNDQQDPKTSVGHCAIILSERSNEDANRSSIPITN